MDQLERVILEWGASLCQEIELAALISRNPTAHKWKATYRSIVLRELALWRVQDLLLQAIALAKQEHILGAIVLVRCAFETLGILIYINEKTESVFRGEESFFVFNDTTTRLMLGSKNQSTPEASINILTVLEHCEKKYPGILSMYGELSESAHPNYEGMCRGYSRVDEKNFITKFSNQWRLNHGNRLSSAIELCLSTFDAEYNQVWVANFEKLEAWLKDNDAFLEASKSDA